MKRPFLFHYFCLASLPFFLFPSPSLSLSLILSSPHILRR